MQPVRPGIALTDLARLGKPGPAEFLVAEEATSSTGQTLLETALAAAAGQVEVLGPMTAHSVRSADLAKAGERAAGNLVGLIGRVIQARLRWWPQSAAA